MPTSVSFPGHPLQKLEGPLLHVVREHGHFDDGACAARRGPSSVSVGHDRIQIREKVLELVDGPGVRQLAGAGLPVVGSGAPRRHDRIPGPAQFVELLVGEDRRRKAQSIAERDQLILKLSGST